MINGPLGRCVLFTRAVAAGWETASSDAYSLQPAPRVRQMKEGDMEDLALIILAVAAVIWAVTMHR